MNYNYLTDGQNRALIELLQQVKKGSYEYDKIAEKLLLGNESLIRYKTKPYMKKSFYEDLLQECRMAILEAAETFDVKGKNKFTSYAGNNIDFAIMNTCAKNRTFSGTASISREFKSAYAKLIAENKDITIDNLVKKMNRDVSEIVAYLDTTNKVNLDDSITESDGFNKALFYKDIVVDERSNPEEKYVKKQQEKEFELAMSFLSNTHKSIFKLTMQGLTQCDIARKFNFSQVSISRFIDSGESYLRFLLQDDNIKVVKELTDLRKIYNSKNCDIKKLANICNLNMENLINYLVISNIKYRRRFSVGEIKDLEIFKNKNSAKNFLAGLDKSYLDSISKMILDNECHEYLFNNRVLSKFYNEYNKYTEKLNNENE